MGRPPGLWEDDGQALAREQELAMRWARLLSVWLVICHSPVGLADEGPKPTYAELLETARSLGENADFTALRLAYAASDRYDPYDSRCPKCTEFDEALDFSDPKRALELGVALEDSRFLDAYHHKRLGDLYSLEGNGPKAGYHAGVARALAKSVLASGDGRSAETAYVVISTREEYLVLAELGLTLKEQALQTTQQHSFDVLTVQDANGVEFSLYFNVDLPLRWLRSH